jgi:hypothetical protein
MDRVPKRILSSWAAVIQIQRNAQDAGPLRTDAGAEAKPSAITRRALDPKIIATQLKQRFAARSDKQRRLESLRDQQMPQLRPARSSMLLFNYHPGPEPRSINMISLCETSRSSGSTTPCRAPRGSSGNLRKAPPA